MKTILTTVMAMIGLVCACRSGWADRDHGLVGYWPFDGNARDQSGNGNHGSVAGATLAADRFGRATNAFHFDGIDDFIDIPYSPIIEPDVFSVSVWAKTMASSWQSIIGSDPNRSGCLHGWQLDLNAWGAINAMFSVDPSANCGDGTSITYYRDFRDGQWHHFVGVRGSRQRLYVDGVLVRETATNAYPKTQASLRIGMSRGRGYWFSGAIDDVRIYNRELTPSEVLALYGGPLYVTKCLPAGPTNSWNGTVHLTFK